MKSLFFTFTLLIGLNAYATPDLPTCDMENGAQAPCLMGETDTAIYLLAMMMTNAEGLEMVNQIADDVNLEDVPNAEIILLETNEEETKQSIDFNITLACKAERNCKEYLWKVNYKVDEEAEEPTESYTNELTKVPLES